MKLRIDPIDLDVAGAVHVVESIPPRGAVANMPVPPNHAAFIQCGNCAVGVFVSGNGAVQVNVANNNEPEPEPVDTGEARCVLCDAGETHDFCIPESEGV